MAKVENFIDELFFLVVHENKAFVHGEKIIKIGQKYK